MKLKRPAITPGPWRNDPAFPYVIYGGRTKVAYGYGHSVNSVAISQVPEIMDTLEYALEVAEFENFSVLEEKLVTLMLAMGYTQEESLPEPEINPSES